MAQSETFQGWAERKGIADDPFGFKANGCEGRVTIPATDPTDEESEQA